MVMCKESSKPSKLSTKLSTIWQINDYLSKKIDNRLIVDIIDTRGHPVCHLWPTDELQNQFRLDVTFTVTKFTASFSHKLLTI